MEGGIRGGRGGRGQGGGREGEGEERGGEGGGSERLIEEEVKEWEGATEQAQLTVKLQMQDLLSRSKSHK